MDERLTKLINNWADSYFRVYTDETYSGFAADLKNGLLRTLTEKIRERVTKGNDCISVITLWHLIVKEINSRIETKYKTDLKQGFIECFKNDDLIQYFIQYSIDTLSNHYKELSEARRYGFSSN